MSLINPHDMYGMRMAEQHQLRAMQAGTASELLRMSVPCPVDPPEEKKPTKSDNKLLLLEGV